MPPCQPNPWLAMPRPRTILSTLWFSIPAMNAKRSDYVFTMYKFSRLDKIPIRLASCSFSKTKLKIRFEIWWNIPSINSTDRDGMLVFIVLKITKIQKSKWFNVISKWQFCSILCFEIPDHRPTPSGWLRWVQQLLPHWVLGSAAG